MARLTPCPPPDTLDDLLANRLPADRAAEVRTHVAGCTACQQTLGRGPIPTPRPKATEYPFLSPPREPSELGWLDDYRITGLLGEGGMGIVFAAEEPMLGRKLALKVLKPQYNDATTRERFLREAKAIAALPPSHVVHLYAVGEANGLPYLAMERLHGESLATRLKRDRWLPVSDALRIAREAAEGLAVLHERGLVHRDIKPDNIWLEGEGQGRYRDVKLIDFGIARLVSGESDLTRPGQVVGTPVYMAPEQAAGQPVDGRVDLYSLGCVLYHMVTGLTPFDVSKPGTMLILQAVIKGDAPSVRIAAPNLSPPVAELIQQLMARDPAARPQSATVVVERLRQLEQEERLGVTKTQMIQTSASGNGRRGPRRAGLLGMVVGSVAVVAALIVALVATYMLFWPSPGGKGNPPLSGPDLPLGVLFSQSDTTAVHEMPLVEAVQLAVEEINKKDGVLGRKLALISEDGASSEKVFEERATKLIEKDKVAAIIGCWTSASRKRVAAVCARHDRLLLFPASYEGLEETQSVIQLGGTPNQTIIPLVKYAYADLRKRRFYFVGSENLYSYAIAEILQHEIEKLGAEVVGRRYLLVGDTDMAAVLADVKKTKPDMIVCTFSGDANLALFRGLRASDIRPPAVPTAWLNISEPELVHFRARDLVGDYAADGYFESVDTATNREFIERFRKRFGANRRVNDAMQSAYAGVYLWKKAVEKAQSTDTDAVRKEMRGLSIDAPEGPIKIDRINLNAWRTARVGRVVSEEGMLSFQIVHHTPGPVEPEPFPDWRTRKEWDAFLKKLYTGWGDAWEKHR